MDGNEFGRQAARLRAEGRAHEKAAALRRRRPEATTATAAECVRIVKEPLRRFEALRRRPEPDPLPAWWAARKAGGGGPLARGR